MQLKAKNIMKMAPILLTHLSFYVVARQAKIIIMKINFSFFVFPLSFYENQKKKTFLHLKYVFCVNHPRSLTSKNQPQSITLFTFYWQPKQQKNVSFNYRIILKIINLHLRNGSGGKIQFEKNHKICLSADETKTKTETFSHCPHHQSILPMN